MLTTEFSKLINANDSIGRTFFRMRTDMAVVLRFIVKTFVTRIAPVSNQTGTVRNQMLIQCQFARVFFIANVAFPLIFVMMSIFVLMQLLHAGKFSATHIASE